MKSEIGGRKLNIRTQVGSYSTGAPLFQRPMPSAIELYGLEKEREATKSKPILKTIHPG